MDYKKIIIEMVEEEQNTGKLRFVYMILAKYLKTKMQEVEVWITKKEYLLYWKKLKQSRH